MPATHQAPQSRRATETRSRDWQPKASPIAGVLHCVGDLCKCDQSSNGRLPAVHLYFRERNRSALRRTQHGALCGCPVAHCASLCSTCSTLLLEGSIPPAGPARQRTYFGQLLQFPWHGHCPCRVLHSPMAGHTSAQGCRPMAQLGGLNPSQLRVAPCRAGCTPFTAHPRQSRILGRRAPLVVRSEQQQEGASGAAPATAVASAAALARKHEGASTDLSVILPRLKKVRSRGNPATGIN